MGKLANILAKEVVKALKKAHWEVVGQVGSRVVMSEAGFPANLSIPQHRKLSVGTLRALIRNAGMSVDDFLQLG